LHAFRGEDKSNYDQTVQAPASIKEKTTSISITPQKTQNRLKLTPEVKNRLTTKYTEGTEVTKVNQYKKS